MEGCFGFAFSEDLQRHFLWVLHCFGVFWTILDIVFIEAWYLANLIIVTFYLSERQASLASQTLSVSTAVPIAYWIQVHSYQPVEALLFNGLETMLHCTLPSENSYKLFTVHRGLSATATESDQSDSASHLDAIENTYYWTHAGMNITLDPDIAIVSHYSWKDTRGLHW